MKKCGYCAKEISYHEMYCCDDCQIEANRYYDKKEKFQKFFSFINGVFVLGVGIFIFLYSFDSDVGAIGAASCMMILGLTDLLLPFPIESMIEKYKLKKAVFITRIIAACVIGVGAAVLILCLCGVL